MDQTWGEKKSGPYTHTRHDKNIEALICQLKNASILAETKIEIMQWAVAKTPKCALVSM